jgi:hypothetical protein
MVPNWRRMLGAVLVAGLLCWLPVAAEARPSVGTAAAATCSGQLIRNPGFESGPVYWTAPAGVITNSSSESPHSGSWDAVLGILGGTQTISQTITIPFGCQATLSFWLHIDTAETTTTTAYDKLILKMNSTTLKTWSNLNHNAGYTQYSLSLPSGTFALTFTATEDSSLLTLFVLDDVTLTLS